MVLKSASVLSCLIPARLGHQRSDSPAHARDQEKHPKHGLVASDRLGDADLDPFRGNSFPIHRETDPGPRIAHPDLSRARANTAPSGLLSSPLMPNGSMSELPKPAHRSLVPPVRPKRSSFTTFFAFSSKRRSAHGPPIVIPKLQQDFLVPPQSVSGSGRPRVHLVNPASIPSPLRTDDEEYYYSCASLSPASHSASHNPDAASRSPSKQPSVRQQDLIRHPDLDSQLSSPVDSHLTHTQIRHPYAYSTPLYSNPCPKPIDTAPRLRHASSQPFQHHSQGSRTGITSGSAHNRMPSSHLGHEASKSQPHLSQPELKTSMSTPNLAMGMASVRPRSFLRKKPSTRSKAQERWLSAESWWDALFSPSPRFKVKRAPRPSPVADTVPIIKPVQDESNRNMAVTFPSSLAARPRAVSVMSAASNVKHTVPPLTRSRSAVDLSGQPSTSAAPRAGFEPALETLVDQPTPPPDQASSSDSELPLPDPPLSLEQVLDEGEALEQQRAKWKEQASKSLGNKHTRSISRARSKSFGEKQIRLGRHAQESSKAQLNLEFLAARTLLGSQSMRPVVHVSKPSSSSFHFKAYSHSHSQSAYSFSHSSHSRPYSHSHSHSLTTSNSSKSSRNHPPRAHSRNGSWGKTFLRAGVLCGIGQDDSYVADERVPSSSRVDAQGTTLVGHSANTERVLAEAEKVSPDPSDPIGEVGIAISSSPPLEGSFDPGPRHQGGDQENRRHTHKSSEYAGPHPSAFDSSLPPFGSATDVSMRHRLPPRAAIHPPITPIAHPYRSSTTQSGQVGNKGSQGVTSKVTDGQESKEPYTGRTPHLSLSQPDFEQYGVGEALVYASPPRLEVPVAKQVEGESEPSPATEPPSSQGHSSSCGTAALQSDRDSSSLAVNSVPSLTNSTIQMVMSAFNNPDALDEFQDLFYKPHSASQYQRREPSVVTNQSPTDVHSSTSGSPLTHLVRKLSEEVHSLRDPSRTPSDPIFLQRSESRDSSNKSGNNFVFMDVARSSSPPPMESSSQLHIAIAEPSETPSQPVTAIPEDVNSFYTSSVLESPLEDRDNDTFGYPIRHGQLETATAPTTVQSPIRTSTHASIQEDDADDNETAFLSPVVRRYGLVSVDAVRASYVTTSDLSQMSGLSDFPLPPGARPVSILHAYSEATLSASSSDDDHSQSDEETEMGHRDRLLGREPSDDVEATLRALRMAPRITSYESRRSTFGGSEDMDFITELHQAGP